jgi:hypothetical protein
MRRLFVTAAVALSSAAGAWMITAPAAHADGACVTAHAVVNGTTLVDQTQCTPAAPALPPLPALP